MKKVTPKDIFVGWKTVTVNSKLDRTTTKKNEKQQELQELERALQLAKKTEGDLMMDMVRMETETKQLRARLGNIRAKIEAQKVPEIREIIVSVGNSLKSMGDVALKNVETIINEIEQSPDPVKFTQMYFIEHMEKSSSKLDAHIEREAKMERAEKKERKSGGRSQANLDEVEILPNAFIASLIDISFRKFRKEPSLSKRFSILMKKFVLPKACRTNTESFRSEISQDDVQVVYKRHSNNLRKLFSYYAAQSAKAEKKAMKERGEKFVKDTGNEAGINLDSWIRMLRDTKLITRPGDMRHDFPEDNARKVFINVQMSAGDEDDNEEIKSSQSSGDESMIYLEFLEAVAAVACYKYVNPYTPLSTRLETFFKEQLLEVGLKVIKQRKR